MELLGCCLRVNTKTGYLIINIFDIIISLMALGFLNTGTYFIIFNEALSFVFYIALLILAIVSLV